MVIDSHRCNYGSWQNHIYSHVYLLKLLLFPAICNSVSVTKFCELCDSIYGFHFLNLFLLGLCKWQTIPVFEIEHQDFFQNRKKLKSRCFEDIWRQFLLYLLYCQLIVGTQFGSRVDQIGGHRNACLNDGNQQLEAIGTSIINLHGMFQRHGENVRWGC